MSSVIKLLIYSVQKIKKKLHFKIQPLLGVGETIFSCPHTFKFRTRLLTGTTSGMASDCVRCKGGGGMASDCVRCKGGGGGGRRSRIGIIKHQTLRFKPVFVTDCLIGWGQSAVARSLAAILWRESVARRARASIRTVADRPDEHQTRPPVL